MKAEESASNTVELLLVRNLLEAFNERDAVVRRAVLEEVWHDEGVFIDPEGPHRGKAEIDAAIASLFGLFENYEFSVNGVIRAYHGVGCMPWAYGPVSDPKRTTGIDVGTAEDGRMRSLYTFVDLPLELSHRVIE